MTKAEQARQDHGCPKCHVQAGQPCKKNRNRIGDTAVLMPGTAMKGVHAERLAKVPATKTN
jgi:hypothetical protein